jgi:hypothetical protein
MNDPFIPISPALTLLDQTAGQAWGRQTCPPAARFWHVALGLTSWAAPERTHLRGCARCRDYADQVKEAVHAVAARRAVVVAAALALVASRRLARLASANHFAAEAIPSPEVRLTFPSDPHLSAVLYRDGGGDHWLHLEHAQLPVGTLVHVVCADPDDPATAWDRYVVLRRGFQYAVAQTQVEEALPGDGRERQLSIRVVPPATLPAEAAGPLRESFARAQQDDPAATQPAADGTASAWQLWAGRALRGGRLDPAVRAVLEEICSGPGTDRHPARDARRGGRGPKND